MHVLKVHGVPLISDANMFTFRDLQWALMVNVNCKNVSLNNRAQCLSSMPRKMKTDRKWTHPPSLQGILAHARSRSSSRLALFWVGVHAVVKSGVVLFSAAMPGCTSKISAPSHFCRLHPHFGLESGQPGPSTGYFSRARAEHRREQYFLIVLHDAVLGNVEALGTLVSDDQLSTACSKAHPCSRFQKPYPTCFKNTLEWTYFHQIPSQMCRWKNQTLATKAPHRPAVGKCRSCRTNDRSQPWLCSPVFAMFFATDFFHVCNVLQPFEFILLSFLEDWPALLVLFLSCSLSITDQVLSPQFRCLPFAFQPCNLLQLCPSERPCFLNSTKKVMSQPAHYRNCEQQKRIFWTSTKVLTSPGELWWINCLF